MQTLRKYCNQQYVDISEFSFTRDFCVEDIEGTAYDTDRKWFYRLIIPHNGFHIVHTHQLIANEMMFQATILPCKAILGWEQPGMNFVMNHTPGAGSIT